MKKAVMTALLFIILLAAATAFICGAAEKPDFDTGSLAVAANEIEQLISEGKTEAAAQCAAELREALSGFNAESGCAVYLWVMFGVCSAVIFAAFLYVGAAILRPFEKLSGFAERIAGGDFDLPLNYERGNYFGRFTWAFDCMRREITSARACEKAAIENNKTVIASLSHDIKTPVASIRAYAEALEAGFGDNPEKRAKYLGVIMRKCDEVAALTNDMLLHSVSDLDRLKMEPEDIELCAFLSETAGGLSARGNILLNLPEYQLRVSADRNRLAQAVGNIVGNAEKYAKTDIEITAEKTDNGAEITFRDFGGGIPEEELPFIFDKFYRGSRIGRENGAGLGLYIVKYIVTRSGGEVFAENLPDGFRIKIILPVIS
ncbi:MAG: sensor histidine kinase [Oscillospiraceae bacterium]